MITIPFHVARVITDSKLYTIPYQKTTNLRENLQTVLPRGQHTIATNGSLSETSGFQTPCFSII